MNLKRVSFLLVSVLPLALPLFAACNAPLDESSESEGAADTAEANVGVAAQAVVGVATLAGGNFGSLERKPDGTVWAWGNNSHGQLGDGTTTNRATRVRTLGLSDVTGVAAGATSYAFALKSDGTLWAWGSNLWGQLGTGAPGGTDQDTPMQVLMPASPSVTAMVASNIHPIAMTSDGTVWSWGFNGDGQLGNGTTGGSTTSPARVQVLATGGGLADLSGITVVAGGAGHGLARKWDGTVWAWGSNSRGQVGNGTTTDANTAVQVGGSLGPLTGITDLAAGSHYSLARKSDGTVWAWGMNAQGQLGDGTTTDRSAPVQVIGLSGITAVVSSYESSLALKSDGTVWAWGFNGRGQLGDGTTTNRSTPVQVHGVDGIGMLTGVLTIAAGDRHSLAQTSDGTIVAFGANNNGQLGDGTILDRPTPVPVSLPCSVACAPRDQCHLVGVCDASTGVCSDPTAADGSACGTGETCTSGVCSYSVSIGLDCAGATPILETIEAAGCVNFSAATISAGPSYVVLNGAGTYTLHEGPNCTGGKRQASADTYFCGYTYDNGHELNDNARSISFP